MFVFPHQSGEQCRRANHSLWDRLQAKQGEIQPLKDECDQWWACRYDPGGRVSNYGERMNSVNRELKPIYEEYRAAMTDTISNSQALRNHGIFNYDQFLRSFREFR